MYVIQKRVIRLVCKTGYIEHTAELFTSLYVLPFYDLMKYKIAIFMYKVYHKTLPMTVLMLFTQNHYQTGQSKKKLHLGYEGTNKKQSKIKAKGYELITIIIIIIKGVLYIMEHAFGIK